MTKYFYILHNGVLSKAKVNDRGGFDDPITIPPGEHVTYFSDEPDLTIDEFKRLAKLASDLAEREDRAFFGDPSETDPD